MAELVERAVGLHLQSSGDEARPNRRFQEIRLAQKRQRVGEEAYNFFQTATHPDFRRTIGSIATAGKVRPHNKGKIITYHGPFAKEYRTVKDRQVTVAKQVRLYDFRNGATGVGPPTIHIEAAILDGIVLNAETRVPGSHILADIKIDPADFEATIVKVRGQDDKNFGVNYLLEDPSSLAWDEVLDDLSCANKFLETGVVTRSTWENGRLISHT